jgi:hypothetical protein
MIHRSSKDMRVHLRYLESVFLPQRVECVDRVLLVMVPRAVPAHQCLPSSVCLCLSTSRMRGRTSMLPTTSCPSKTSTVQVNSMRPSLGTLLTLYSEALVMPN